VCEYRDGQFIVIQTDRASAVHTIRRGQLQI